MAKLLISIFLLLPWMHCAHSQNPGSKAQKQFLICGDFNEIQDYLLIAPRVGFVFNEWNFSAGPNIAGPYLNFEDKVLASFPGYGGLTDFGVLFNGFNLRANRKIWQISNQSTLRAGGFYMMQIYRRSVRPEEFGGRNFTQNHFNATLSFQRDINAYTSWYITTGTGVVYISGTKDEFVNFDTPFPHHLSIGIKQRLF